MESAAQLLNRFEEFGIPNVRPNDYFAQMLKSDDHMRKVKQRLVVEQRKIAVVEERKSQSISKKFSKQVHLSLFFKKK